MTACYRKFFKDVIESEIISMMNTNTKTIARNKNTIMMLVAWVFAIVGGIVAIVQSARLTAYANNVETAPSAVETLAEPKYEDNEVIIPTSLYTFPRNDAYSGLKCYESYTAITDTTSAQYALQKKATTNDDAFRVIGDRYLVAIGTYFDAPVGAVIDIILENGTIIPAIVGDIKSDEDTDFWNIFSENGCATEFIVDATQTRARVTGDVSSLYESWQSKVKAIRVYDGKNILAA